jgi:hypothetical protein
LTFGALGAGLDLGGSGLRLGNLSKSFPTLAKALEGVSAPQVTRTGGRLGLSNQGGSINLGGTPEQPPQMKLSAEPEVMVPKAKPQVKEVVPTVRQTAPKAKTPKSRTVAQKPKTVEVTPEQSQRFEQIMALSKGGDKAQAAQGLRELKVEMEPEQYQVLQRQYLASQAKGKALEGYRPKAGERDLADSKALLYPKEGFFPGHLDLMLPNDGFSINAQNREMMEGFYDVIAHGNPRKIRIDTMDSKIGIDHRTLARILKHRQDYDGECIRMLSCSTGALPDGFAQNLSIR